LIQLGLGLVPYVGGHLDPIRVRVSILCRRSPSSLISSSRDSSRIGFRVRVRVKHAVRVRVTGALPRLSHTK